jgi:multiple sugar transport system ATP-binding protein
MVFQSYALYPHMTVAENLAFGLKRHRVPKREIRERVDAAAQMLGIAELMKRKPAQLSGGQRQRVAMGRAIVREPDAFLMDEPLSNLDAKLRVEMRAYLATLHQRLRTTTLYVTHDQTEAMTMGDRVAVMRDGRLQQVDTPRALYERPVNLFVAAFIGSPAMNLLHSRLVADGGALVTDCGPVRLRLPESVVERRPRLREHVGRPVILGIRPEDIEDASLAPSANGSSIEVDVSLAEALGAEVVAHFPLAARPVFGPEDGVATLTARLSPRSRAQTGEPLRVAVDVDRLHFFDPDTEAGIW